MQPPRHALGALLLEQGHVSEAAEVFTADLAAHPGGNIWALHGLSECKERGCAATQAAIGHAAPNLVHIYDRRSVSRKIFGFKTRHDLVYLW